jgi:DDE family transposase
MVAQRNGGYHGTFQGELFPRVGFIVTNLSLSSRAVVRFYNKRGTAEQLIKEGKQAVKMTRLSCHRFRSNEVRLWLSLIAYNLGTYGSGWCYRRRSRTGR